MTYSNNSTQPLALYNPALLPPHILLAEFTARRPLLDALIGIIRNNAADQPLQHALLIGTRGMGKTTTLWAVAYTIKDDPALSKQWLPVVFDEESRRVGDLADFWLEALRQWEHAVNDSADCAQQLLDKAGPDIENAARNAFLNKVDRSGCRALLLIDNLNDLFSSIHDPEPLHRLRAFLMEDSRVMLLGAATRYFDQITDLDQPFYDFFRIFDLSPLSLNEMKTALLALANARNDESVAKTLEQRSGTIEGLYLLTGGNPRLIKTFYRLLVEGLRGDIRTDLERLLDEFTPYFKAVVDALPVQQQRIFDAVALTWDPVEVSAISRTTRVPSNQVSAQLRALGKAGLITEAAGHPKRKSYLLADRFSNIHYFMRHGRAARNRFDWFVALVRLIFPDTQAEKLARLARQTADCGPDGQRDARDLIHSALIRAESDEMRKQLLHATIRESWDKETITSLSEWLDLAEAREHLPEVDIVASFSQMPLELRKNLGYKPDDARWWFYLGHELEKKESCQLAEAAYRKALEKDPNFALAWGFLGSLLSFHFSRFYEAEELILKAIAIDPKNPWQHSVHGCILEKLQRYDDAELAYRKAVELKPQYDTAWLWLGVLLAKHTDRKDEAEQALMRAIQINPNASFLNAFLADLISKNPARISEAYSYIVKAVQIEPRTEWFQILFEDICRNEPSCWEMILPYLSVWCEKNFGNTQVFDFTVNGFLQYARLTSPAHALALLEALPNPAPFETLMDAFRAHSDREHLNRLAPERRVIAIELLHRLSQENTTTDCSD